MDCGIGKRTSHHLEPLTVGKTIANRIEIYLPEMGFVSDIVTSVAVLVNSADKPIRGIPTGWEVHSFDSPGADHEDDEKTRVAIGSR
ncbi:hypothetical protein [Nocardia thraciensis]